MKLQQLKYLQQIVQSDMKISEAAKSLHTAQPGISKQIRQLEDEFQLEIFRRRGKNLTGLTAFGEQLLARTELIFQQVEQIKAMAEDHLHPETGRLKLATTHTQARFALPGPVQEFRRRYPQIELDIYQGTPDQLVGLSRDMDLVIATEGLEGFDGLRLPCYHWCRDLLVPIDHPLTKVKKITLEAIAEYPLITYVFSADRPSFIDTCFGPKGLKPRIALSAADTDVIKTYVRLGLGVGIIARMAYQPDTDHGLVALDASHLFPTNLTEIGIRSNRFMRSYIYDFINYFSPHLKPEQVEKAVLAGTTEHLTSNLEKLEIR